MSASIRAAEQAAACAEAEGAVQWAAVRTRSLSRDILSELSPSGDRFYWERPSEGLALQATGCVHEIVASGAQRFRDCADAARQLFARVHVHGEAAPASAGPILVGGFGFSDTVQEVDRWTGFPPARLVLPMHSVARTRAGAFETTVCRVDPGDDPKEIAALLDEARRPHTARRATSNTRAAHYSARADRPHAGYRDLVEHALVDIAEGELEKVVLARSVRIQANAAFEPTRLLDALRRRHPSCTSFAIGRGDATFLGATPESLLRLSDGCIETAALAGSALRGRTPHADAALARGLTESKKEQAEHAIVVRAIKEALLPHCRQLNVPESPTLLELESIQHLETRITGELKDARHLLELAADLHPTPAVGGAPREAALDWLRDNESLERGWYAGAVGYVDALGGGDLAVALRSALLRGDEADLFAGAGIVTGSDPDAELAETRLKLRPLLTLLLEL